ncbi:LOW QUALITY PROTEIN: putative aminoacrylate hydrolase RutD [Salvia hispanica]|uniref:LOW QUALITY PROTEIN: putative aminoacrylate hydrolase RutD n=1 Tax=Salvia hispanica TaxID=49212 RepID=UPI002009CB5E|nr:LOW QUALITY PROTEIN: putative aminoacrylate hydrolase RutD [Salvia hispanica]
MNIWAPPKNRTRAKRAVVLVHGFAGNGMITWLFQVLSLRRKYAVYVPDLLFFGGSSTARPERSPALQAECLAKGLRKLGVERCTVVGFSYGGIMAFKMAEMQPELVEAVVVSGSVAELSESVSGDVLSRLGFSSLSEMLLPESVEGCEALLRIGMHKKICFPNRLYKDFLEVMFVNTKERAELLEGLIVLDTDAKLPKLSQKVHLLWGEEDQIFKQELAQHMREVVGYNATYESIKKGGHLVHLERPLVYNKCLNHFRLSSLPPPHSSQQTHA